MLNATQPPRRMRFSFESRCRLIARVLAGESPQAAAAACGASRATAWGAQTRSRSEIRRICRRIVFTHPTGIGDGTDRLCGQIPLQGPEKAGTLRAWK